MVKLYREILFLSLLVIFPSFAMRPSCLLELQMKRLEQVVASGKKPVVKIYYPKDFRAGEMRDVVVYFHGFASSAESYENFAKAKLESSYDDLKTKQPVVLSLSLGPTVLAGVEEHGLHHSHFLATSDYWIVLRKALSELDVELKDLSFLANSGGAFNAFQMIRAIPKDITVRRAVFCSFPNFIESGLAPNPSMEGNRDVKGTQWRQMFEPAIQQLASDPHFKRLLPVTSLQDGTLPKSVEILIQAAEFDAFGYTALNQQFVQEAKQLGFPITLKILPDQGHTDEYDNSLSVRFIVFGPKG